MKDRRGLLTGIVACACVMLLSPIAGAQEPLKPADRVGDNVTFVTRDEMQVLGQAREIARLGVGGCIIGPFVIYDENGKTLLSISNGASVPPNCVSVFK